MKQLKPGRTLTPTGGFGADIQLTHTHNTNQVFWSPNGNSYVAMNRDGWGRRDPIPGLTLASINGVGEIRWTINPDGYHSQESQLAVDYFFEEG
jgi:hypothetical protein